MIFEYGFSTVGKSHIKKGTGCQDSHCIRKLENGWVIAAVADGVGSAKNSHIGSKIAAQTVVEFCDECMPWDYNLISIKSMMRTAYNFAYKLILRESQKSGEPIESYDTTLTMVIYDGQRIIYGHSGDGAIIGLTTFGDYVEITRPQKGTDGVSVLPLRSGYRQWVIDTYEEDLSAVLLMTDGMLETLCHYLLRDHIKKTNRAYVPLISFFADPKGFDVQNIEDIKKEIFDFVVADKTYDSSRFYCRLLDIYKKHLSEKAEEIVETIKKTNYPVSLMQAEQDDKTIVGIINTELAFDDKNEAFYSEPNWNALQEAWNRKAYPHLYSKSQNDTQEELTTDTNNSDEVVTDATVEKITETVTREEKNKTEIKIADTGTKSQNADELDDILLLFERRETNKNDIGGSSASNVQGKASSPNTPSKPITNNEDLPPRTKHEKPKRKGFIGKIGDWFD